MKGEPLQKPPPLLLPSKNHPRMIQERSVNRFAAKYDNFNGILKRVRDMRLSMDTDETTTESSEKSESSSVRTRSSGSSGPSYATSFEEASSPFEDESSASSITGSDHCSPYEEISRNNIKNRYSSSFSSLTSPPTSKNTLYSFRDDLPSSPPNNIPLYSNDRIFISRPSLTESSQYINTEAVRRRSSRPTSLYSNYEIEYSNTRTPVYSNTSDIGVTATDVNENQTGDEKSVNGISDAEKRQVEMFFRGLRTDIWVLSCLANLYSSTKSEDASWTFKHTGIPVLLFESGDTKSRNKRRIQILLAERGTCFPLWRDTIDNLSSYRKAEEGFHTMHLSTDHRQLIGLSFDSPEESETLLHQIEVLTADPENINISVPKKKKKATKVKKPAPPPQKKDISNPCLFEHVTSVAAKDKPVYMSLQTLVDQSLVKKPENIA